MPTGRDRAGSDVAHADRLEAKGIVRKVRDAKDRRQVNVTLTEKGIALYPRIDAGLHKVYGHLLNGFSEQEALALEHALEKVLRNARGHVTTPLPGK